MVEQHRLVRESAQARRDAIMGERKRKELLHQSEIAAVEKAIGDSDATSGGAEQGVKLKRHNPRRRVTAGNASGETGEVTIHRPDRKRQPPPPRRHG